MMNSSKFPTVGEHTTYSSFRSTSDDAAQCFSVDSGSSMPSVPITDDENIYSPNKSILALLTISSYVI